MDTYLNSEFQHINGDLRARIDAVPAGQPWTRDLKAEAEWKDSGVNGIVFEKPGKHRVFLAESETDVFRVSNIVPLDNNDLSTLQYNAIERSFTVWLKDQLGSGLVVRASPATVTLEDVVDTEAVLRLRGFSSNRSTGNSHPADRGRWFDFVAVAARATDAENPVGHERMSDLMFEFLQCDGWSEDQAQRLAGEFSAQLETWRELRARIGGS